MATLMPSLSSDEEASPSREASDDEMDNQIDFHSENHCESAELEKNFSKGWSFNSVLDILMQTDQKLLSRSVPRLDVQSLIDAKREVDKPQSKILATKNTSQDETVGGVSLSADLVEPNGVVHDKLRMRSGDETLSDPDNDGDSFFEPLSQDEEDGIESFAQLTLSRPVLKGVGAMGYVKPTSIQAAVIPVALSGRDVCASAVTGSGKTAAFLLPVLERLLFRSVGTIKAVVLVPTRELAAQCYGMMEVLAQHTKLHGTLVVGGSKNLSWQATELRRADIVIATPGRLLDHVTNTQGVSLDHVEFLILDEADRLLDLGFRDEVHELIKACPSERQSLLFSATFTTKVDELIQISLKRPVRVKISSKKSSSTTVEVAPRLEQEFVRIRAGNEGVNREAMLLALLTRTFTSRTIVFFDTKAAAHRIMIIAGLLGIKCCELHGNLNQSQRLVALEQFRTGDVDILLATDLAARGLDITGVDTVINFEMPSNVETYIHRIGRTARAGRGGKSCTLIGEGRRYLMKVVIKDAEEKRKQEKTSSRRLKSGVIRSRTIAPTVVRGFVERIENLQDDVNDILQAEAIARMDRLAEMEAIKAKNLIEYSDDIAARPRREWHLSGKSRDGQQHDGSKILPSEAGHGVHRMTRKKRRAQQAREALRSIAHDDKTLLSEISESAIKRSVRHEKKKAERRMLDSSSRLAIPPKRQRKAASGSDDLFSDERIVLSEAGKEKSNIRLDGLDLYRTIRKKSSKKSVKAFKSRSKFKRKK